MRGEDRLTAWLSRQAGTGRLLGDDAAFLSLPGDVAVTVDSQIEGVHFLPGLTPSPGRNVPHGGAPRVLCPASPHHPAPTFPGLLDPTFAAKEPLS